MKSSEAQKNGNNRVVRYSEWLIRWRWAVLALSIVTGIAGDERRRIPAYDN